MVLNAFRSRIFPLQPTQGLGNSGISGRVANVSDRSHLKMLTPKQILQRLSIALAQAKTGTKSENLLDEIRQTIYSLYRAKEISKKVYNNIMNSIKL